MREKSNPEGGLILALNDAKSAFGHLLWVFLPRRVQRLCSVVDTQQNGRRERVQV